jgi:hypothetical protein
MMKQNWEGLAGKSTLDEINRTIFSSEVVLRHFIRSILSRSFVDPELLSDLVAFEYFSGLNVTERQEQAKDLVEEVTFSLMVDAVLWYFVSYEIHMIFR